MAAGVENPVGDRITGVVAIGMARGRENPGDVNNAAG